jgi:transmembrane sensor
MTFLNYSAENFVANESFQAFVLGTNPGDVAFWTHWRLQHPSKQPEVDQAIQLIQLLAMEKKAVSVSLKQAEVQKLLIAIKAPAKNRNRQKHRPFTSPSPFYFKIAAAFLAILFLAGVAYWQFMYSNRFTEYATPFAQTRIIQLPDGSTVTLNAHSALRTKTDWDGNAPREVWLEGEAFFSVQKKAIPTSEGITRIKFIVHTNNLDVEVLGTQFNVKDRSGKTQVVLTSGKVQLSRNAWLATEKLMLKPGELAEYSSTQPKLTKKAVNPALYSSWRESKLIFSQHTLAEVLQLVEETYGLQVEVTDQALLMQEVTGSIPNPNVDVLLDALAKSLDLKITRKGNQVVLQRMQ